MGRPPSNGGPAFRFNAHEVAEMETILHEHNTQVPAREVLQALADKFSLTPERSGKIEVQMKQVWNWFQNRRYAIRAKAARTPVKYVASSVREDPTAVRNMTQVTQHVYVPAGGTATVQSAGSTQPDSAQMEFEAKSARDGAWYDVTSFLSHKSVETGDPHVLVRFAGFGPEEDEWVNVRKHVRQRSLPCESAECVAVLPGDLILCFQEGKEQALYYDAHVLDAQRRRHDMRGCRCRFLVRYDHDQSEEIVPLKKVCRRPDTDHRLQQLHAMKEKESGSMNQQKTSSLDPHSGNTLRVYPPSEPMQKLQTIEERVGTAAVRLPTNTESKAIQPPQNMDVCAQLEASQPKSAEPISVGEVESTVVQPSNADLPSGSTVTATLTASNAETWTVPPASTTTNTAAIAKAAESSEAYPAANSSANIGATTSTNAETSVPTQADSAMNIDGTVETTMADTSTVPPAGSAANTSATLSAAPTVVAETSVIPSAMDVAIAETSAASPVATTSTVVSTVNVEASVVPGTVEPSVAAPANVDAPSGGDTAAAGMGSDQNVPQG